MSMTGGIPFAHSAAVIFVAAAVTVFLRFAPFILFPANKKLPDILLYMGKVLPGAIMGMLIVYCFRNTRVLTWPHALPELIAGLVVAASYLWKKNILISIAAGTVLYMVLIQAVF